MRVHCQKAWATLYTFSPKCPEGPGYQWGGVFHWPALLWDRENPEPRADVQTCSRKRWTGGRGTTAPEDGSGKEPAWYCWRMFSAWRWPKCSLHKWVLSSGGAGGSDIGTLASCAPNPQSPTWPGYASSCVTEVAGNGIQTKLHISWWRHRCFLATGSDHRKHGHVYGYVRTRITFSLH